MVYVISDYSKEIAHQYGVKVRPSLYANKKIDVYHKLTNDYICSLGDIRCKDYPFYLEVYGQEYADQRASLFWKRFRHATPGSAGYWAKLLLW